MQNACGVGNKRVHFPDQRKTGKRKQKRVEGMFTETERQLLFRFHFGLVKQAKLIKVGQERKLFHSILGAKPKEEEQRAQKSWYRLFAFLRIIMKQFFIPSK